ncbi:MAG: hypothetical protein IT382_14845 [Deltaproteobacteria bacterium]|nr:hypothetical protein [Deltaproteobacteria bacterium]
MISAARVRALLLCCCVLGGGAGCRLLSAELSCTRAEHCPYGSQCGPQGTCVPVDEPGGDAGPADAGVQDDAGIPGDAGVPGDAGPLPDIPPTWWAADFAFAIPLDITGGARSVQDVPVVVEAPLQARLGSAGTLDADSPRVVEHGASGAVEIPSYFSAAQGRGVLVFLLPGELAAGVTRRVWLYVALQDEGGVAAPGYWQNEERDPVQGPSVSVSDLDSVPLRPFRLTDQGLDLILNSSWRVWSTDVDHHGAPMAIGAALFTSLQASTVRLDEPSLVVVESIASAGPARVRLLTLLTSERGVLSALSVEELVPDAPLDVYAYADPDVPEATPADDTAFLDTSVDAMVVEDSSEGQMALLHDGRAELETVGITWDVIGQVVNHSLSGTDMLEGTGDAAAAARWSFASVQGPVLVKSAVLRVNGRSDAERIGERFFSASAALGAVAVPRP